MQGPSGLVDDKQITNNPHIASSIIALCCIMVDNALRCELIVRMSPMVPNPGDFLAVANMSRLSNNMHAPTMKCNMHFIEIYFAITSHTNTRTFVSLTTGQGSSSCASALKRLIRMYSYRRSRE